MQMTGPDITENSQPMIIDEHSSRRMLARRTILDESGKEGLASEVLVVLLEQVLREKLSTNQSSINLYSRTSSSAMLILSWLIES